MAASSSESSAVRSIVPGPSLSVLTRIALSWLLALCVIPLPAKTQDREAITIDDLVERVQIVGTSVSPDGNHVAYLSVQGLPRTNAYDVALHLVSLKTKSSMLLAHSRLSPEETFEPDTGVVRPTVAQFAWKPDSGELAYTIHAPSGMELRVRRMSDGRNREILHGFREIEMASSESGPNTLAIHTIQSFDRPQPLGSMPTDFALLVKDGYRFYGPFANPKIHGQVLTQSWVYNWRTITKSGRDVAAYRGFPEEWKEIEPDSALSRRSDTVTYTRDECRSPENDVVAMIEDSNINLQDPGKAQRRSRIILRSLRMPQAEPRVLAGSEDPPPSRSILGWGSDGKELYYLSEGAQHSSIWAVARDAHAREIYQEDAGLAAPSPSSELSQDGRVVVVVRSTNTSPDELLKIDLTTGAATALASPNRKFQAKNPAIVRFIRIACCGGELYGRLYIPKSHKSGEKYPLVFTNYLSSPGFYASVGDEVPILVLVEHGIAVFALDSRPANIVSPAGDFRFEIERIAKPVRAMEWVRQTLASEGLIDPKRCGLTGVSYGAEIAMYAYWKSDTFRAISVATASWEPMNYLLAGVSYSKFLDSRGLSVSDTNWQTSWKQLSASLNLGVEMPALLLQSPDKEEYFGNIETWFRTRRQGLPVEWLLYPNEGHVKRSPSDRWWVYQRNLDWFRFWLQDEEDHDPAKAEQYARWKQMKKP